MVGLFNQKQGRSKQIVLLFAGGCSRHISCVVPAFSAAWAVFNALSILSGFNKGEYFQDFLLSNSPKNHVIEGGGTLGLYKILSDGRMTEINMLNQNKARN